MQTLKRGGFALTVVITVILLATDWPGEWWHGFWLGHPLWAAVVGAFLLLLITAFGVDEYTSRRESQRWQAIGRVASGEFHYACTEGWVAMLELVGIAEIAGQLSPSIQGRLVAVQPAIAAHRAELDAIPMTAHRRRVELLAADPSWSRGASPVLSAVGTELANALSRWSAVLLTLRDEEMFEAVNRFGRFGIDISDLSTGMTELADPRLTPAQVADGWMSLYGRFVADDEYWNARFRDEQPRRSVGRRFDADAT